MEKLMEKRQYYRAQLEEYRRFMASIKAIPERLAAQNTDSFSSQTSMDEQFFDSCNFEEYATTAAHNQQNRFTVPTAPLSYVVRPDAESEHTMNTAGEAERYCSSTVEATANQGISTNEQESLVAEEEAERLTLSQPNQAIRGESVSSPAIERFKEQLNESKSLIQEETSQILADQPASLLVESIKEQIDKLDASLSQRLSKSGCHSLPASRTNYQRDIQETIRQLGRLERDNEVSHLKQHQSKICELAKREEKIIESNACDADEFRVLSLRLNEQVNESENRGTAIAFEDLAVQTQEFCDKEIQCSLKRSRKPELASRLFTARIASFSDSYMSLSQTSQEYLKWRRGNK